MVFPFFKYRGHLGGATAFRAYRERHRAVYKSTNMPGSALERRIFWFLNESIWSSLAQVMADKP